MSNAATKEWTIAGLSEYISELISKKSGNVLEEKQQSMVENRLSKRMLDLGDLSPNDYYQYLTNHYEDEIEELVSLLTTHHTFFFREFCHFEFIQKNIHQIVSNVKARGEKTINVWSAACSRGQEVYSISMFLNHCLKSYPDMDYRVFGTDIDSQSVNTAKNGVYRYEEVKVIPKLYLNGNWQRGTGDISDFAKVKKHIQEKCSFAKANLLDLGKTLTHEKFDVVFCRNVLIYFTESDTEKAVLQIKNYLQPKGYLITGLSESLNFLKIDKKNLAPSVYSFDTSVEKVVSEVIEKPAAPVIPSPIKMLVVDDSNSIVKLLSKIFSSDPQFELVGTAGNGLEAEEFLKNHEVDAMTLDIHMPEMDGVEYLKKNHNKNHPKVVVVSSASREDSRYAGETLRHGATDFVEKPALNNLAERAEEIKVKIKMAFLNENINETKIDKDFEKSFQIKNFDNKARYFFGSFSDFEKIKHTVKSFQNQWPPVFWFLEGNQNFLELIKEKFFGVNVEVFTDQKEFNTNTIYLCDFKNHFSEILELNDEKIVSYNVFGECSNNLLTQLKLHSDEHILVEDVPGNSEKLRSTATDIFPWTSFSHVSTEFLAKK